MFCKASNAIYYITAIAFRMVTISEASVKWEIKTKPLIIGHEARLSCNTNNCPPENTKKWLGGQDYDLLCQDNQSKNPLKYEMTSNGTNFDLMIKNFNFPDVNCEYTCACGFQQYTSMLKVNAQELVYPPRLQEGSLTKSGDKFSINLLMEVFPAPNCTLMFHKKVLSVNISVRSILDDGYFEIFEVAIQQTVESPGNMCKGNITLHCEVGTNAYSFHLHRPDLCKEEEKTKVVLYVIIGSVAGIFSFVSFLFCIKCKNAKHMKHSTESGKENNPDLTYPCMVQLMEEQHNGGH